MALAEQMVLDDELVCVNVVAEVAFLGRRGILGLLSCQVLKVELGLLLFGPGVLKPDLNDPLLQSDLTA